MSAPTFASALIDATCSECGEVGRHRPTCLTGHRAEALAEPDRRTALEVLLGPELIGPDLVNHPPHYIATLDGRTYEVADVCEAFGLGLRLGQVVQYVLRADRKGNALQDLKKAAWWLDREIALRTKGGAR